MSLLSGSHFYFVTVPADETLNQIRQALLADLFTLPQDPLDKMVCIVRWYNVTPIFWGYVINNLRQR
jgi:hypothetical protein